VRIVDSEDFRSTICVSTNLPSSTLSERANEGPQMKREERMTFCLIMVQDAEAWEREPQTEKDRVYSEHMKV
jgi:hypothetical protein